MTDHLQALCAICALPASNGGYGADARCTACDKAADCTLAALPSMRVALSRTLRDALVEASSKAAIPCWLSPDERPERSLKDNLSALSAAKLRATAQWDGHEKPSATELTARDVARVICLGPTLGTAASVLGGSQLSAPLSRVVRLALLAGSAEAFGAATERLREAADADAPVTLSLLCSAVCAPRVLDVAEAALCGRREARGERLASCTMHGVSTCDCGGVMGGGFL